MSTIHLAHGDAGLAADALRQAKLPGLEEVAGAPGGRTLYLIGSASALVEARKIGALLDVQPREVRLGVRLSRVHPGSEPEELAQTSVIARNNAEATVAIDHVPPVEVRVAPRINSERSVTLETRLTVGWRTGISRGVRSVMRTAAGRPARFYLPDDGGQGGTGLVLDITPEPDPR